MKVQKTKEDWQERMGTIRQLQEEEGNVTATITSWNLTDNEKFVEFEYRIDPLEKVHTEQFKAPEPADDDTVLERFLDELGYNISTMHLIETDQPEFEVSLTDDGDWSIKDMIETDKKQSKEYESPEFDTEHMILVGLFCGFFIFPDFVWGLYQRPDELYEDFTHKLIAVLFACSAVHLVVVSISLTYLITIIYLY